MKSCSQIMEAGSRRELLVDGSPFIILGGELRNSSASTKENMEKLCPKAREFGLNTLLVPIYWELLEPEEDNFDFSLLDGHIASARANGLKLVLLWFGTWKNATSCYVPGWVKSDLSRFPRLQLSSGVNANAISCFSGEARNADARAFTQMMRRIKKMDETQNTVIMVQVENEVGVLGASRDRCVAAEREFKNTVPLQLLNYLSGHVDVLTAEMKLALSRSEEKPGGDWEQIFKNDAAEVFMAWHIAKYIEHVAASGKKEYELPLFANAWLIHKDREKPGQYPSGGPVPKMLDVWKAAAPSIDFFAPDIYKHDFKSSCDSYSKANGLLFIPETNWDKRSAASVFYAIGQPGGIGFAPFAIDDILGTEHPLSETYRILSRMTGLIADAQRRSAIVAFYQQEKNQEWSLDAGGYSLIVKPRGEPDVQAVPAGGLIISLGDGVFLIAGRNALIEFSTKESRTSNIEFISVEEICVLDDKIIPGRRLNGDETYHGKTVILNEALGLLRVRLNLKTIPVQHQSGWEFVD
jgi:beta-galactosidase GanA